MFNKSLLIADRKLFLHHPIIRTRSETRNKFCCSFNHRQRGTISEFQCIFMFSVLTKKTGGANGHKADFCFCYTADLLLDCLETPFQLQKS